MSVTIEQDLKEILNKFEQKIDKISEDLQTRFDKVDERLTKIEVGQAEIKGDIKALDERIKGVDERLKSVKFINRSVVVGLVLALTAGFLKLFFPGFSSNP